jgi:hypothetical protein
VPAHLPPVQADGKRIEQIGMVEMMNNVMKQDEVTNGYEYGFDVAPTASL